MKRQPTARLLDALAVRIENLRALDGATPPLSAVAEGLRKSRRLTDLLSGTPLGHPLHPLLVAVPIGGWSGALVLDMVGNREGARTMIGLGVLSAVPAAASGLSDWRDTEGAEKRVGTAHALLNTAVLALYAASWWARRRDHHVLGVGLSVPAMGLLSASGWLGGHLAYALGVGVDTTAFSTTAEDWTDVATLDDLDEKGIGVATVEGVSVLLARTGDGAVVAYADRCTHRGGPLHEGEVVDGCIVCPWHDSAFDLRDGSVAAGPATRPQPAYEVKLEGDRILIRRNEERALRTNPVGS
jgi:nitrite reductase/ring-hydroxylating ferredoxin subunit/uncharacterized membrane protein